MFLVQCFKQTLFKASMTLMFKDEPSQTNIRAEKHTLDITHLKHFYHTIRDININRDDGVQRFLS